MRHEILVGLRVIDEPGYARYRAAMTPLLEHKKVRTEHFDAAADSAEVIAAFDL
jgi:hypothetical protein